MTKINRDFGSLQLVNGIITNIFYKQDMAIFNFSLFLSDKFLMREKEILKKAANINHYKWIRHGNKIVVLLKKGTEIKGIGWSECSKYDKMNEKIGISIALVRALRDMR